MPHPITRLSAHSTSTGIGSNASLDIGLLHRWFFVTFVFLSGLCAERGAVGTFRLEPSALSVAWSREDVAPSSRGTPDHDRVAIGVDHHCPVFRRDIVDDAIRHT